MMAWGDHMAQACGGSWSEPGTPKMRVHSINQAKRSQRVFNTNGWVSEVTLPAPSWIMKHY